ncbi:MAG: T9SS type A sorting domain-containing protein [Dysgonamonadaceae bacterium]|jgi:hypothetical protein|nr:T9SS type A sorting domain-containing protein [Dysgonamonadaceae bacterium]
MKKNKGIRLTAALIWLVFSLQAQTVGTWKSYMAYNNATIVTETPNAVYAVYNGSLLSYSPEDQSVQTYSIQDDLNPSAIRFLNYCPDTRALLIVYDNSNIDIFLGRNHIYHLPDIANNLFLSNKTVNSVEIRGRYAYLATGFGIVVVDMQKREIKNTYQFDANTTAVCEWDGYLYAATDNGLIRAALSSNLLDKTNWSKVSGADGIHIDKMVLFKDHLVLYNNEDLSTWSFSREGILKQLASNNYLRQLSVLNDQLVMIYWSGVIFYKDFETSTGIVLDDQVKCISSGYSGNRYWIAWGDRGIVQIALKSRPDGWSDYETLVSGLKANSPGRNFAFRLKFSGEKLLVTGGDRAGDRAGRPGTFMIYENGVWQNLDDRAIAAKTGISCMDLTDAVEDPLNPGRYYVSSWGEGIYVLNKDLELETLYSLHNSTLQSTLPNSENANRFVRVDGMVFDANHNLYTVSAGITNGLNILSNTGHWSAHVYDHLSGIAANRIIIARDGKKWVNFFRKGSAGPIGIFVLDDTKGVADDSGDDSKDIVYYSSQFIDQQGKSSGAAAYNCIVEDLSGTVWVGTDNGPITFSSAEQVERGECYRITGVDEYGAGYYPLEGQKVMTIAVDGGNRKWIGTDGGGVFLVDQSNGNLTVENFNTGNSPILSDNITSIAINGKTGEVFIGTNRGICSYQGDAIEGRPDYSEVHAFPNPVFPRRNNQVVITGLMQNSRVKITDTAGNLMKEAVSNGGQYTWNCTNPKGEIVAAGIYLVFATLSDGSQGMVTKIMVLK